MDVKEIKDTDYYESESNGILLSGALLNAFHKKGSGGQPENMKNFFKHNNDNINLKLRKLKDPEKTALGLSGSANTVDPEIIKIPKDVKSWTNKQCSDFLREWDLITNVDRLSMNQGSHKGAVKRLKDIVTEHNEKVSETANLDLKEIGLPGDFFSIKRKDMPRFITNDLAAAPKDLGIDRNDKLGTMREKVIKFQRKVHGV